MNHRDRTFCSSDCKVSTCWRFFGDEQRAVEPQVALNDYSTSCLSYDNGERMFEVEIFGFKSEVKAKSRSQARYRAWRDGGDMILPNFDAWITKSRVRRVKKVFL